MKKYTGIWLLLVVLILSAGAVLAEPQLTIPESLFDFGLVPQNSTISHIFWLHSTGTDSLKIANVRPG